MVGSRPGKDTKNTYRQRVCAKTCQTFVQKNWQTAGAQKLAKSLSKKLANSWCTTIGKEFVQKFGIQLVHKNWQTSVCGGGQAWMDSRQYVCVLASRLSWGGGKDY